MSFRLPILLALALALRAQVAAPWSVARSGHLEVYSHQDDAEARRALLWFEQLRGIALSRFHLKPANERPVSVIGFASEAEYEPYRLRATADAYYVGTDERDYIVLSNMRADNFGTAAHEYAHLLMHRAGAQLPSWLSEGLADVFSTIRMGRDGAQFGGAPPGRLESLRTLPWLPLDRLVSLAPDSAARNTRAGSQTFYAQSWLLTEMLLFSPDYRMRFRNFVTRIPGAPGSSAAVLESVYGKSPAGILLDLEAWLRRRKSVRFVIETPQLPSGSDVETAEVSNLSIQVMVAGTLLAAGDWDRAEAIYREAAVDAPREPSILGGLGAVALGKGRAEESHRLFGEALSHGLSDAGLCYRYAGLLDAAGGSVDDRRAALARAVEIRPDFDDARYALALLEKNLGNNQAALEQLRAMRRVAPPRAYHYWFALADALAGLGRNDEAVTAAQKAAGFASTPEDREHADQLAHVARTHVAVRFARDASGRQQLVTTRVSNDEAAWNPFIEPTDDIRRVEGTLVEIICGSAGARVVVETGGKKVTAAIPDPTRVQMRNAPSEFTCGPQSPVSVVLQYAASKAAGADGIARGIEFR